MSVPAAESRRFEVALSFPGEHRPFVKQVAEHLAAAITEDRLLYDHYHDVEFARLDLNTYLPALYRKESELIVVFLCPEYTAKLWCRLEWRHVTQLIATADAARVMFLSFGNPGDLSEFGILGGDGYIDVLPHAPQVIAEKILKRLAINRGDARRPKTTAPLAAGPENATPENTTPENATKPHFASAAGQDQYGTWCEIEIENVVQRLRWIAPGEFWMGSPASEAERQADEGPRHRVRLTQGYWLADTACTQALWHAVMGSNPSRFKDDPENPVETVSWDDVQEFLRTLHWLLPNSAPVLPTEAEWEYACRAGTRAPFSFGDNITPEQVNYDGNRPYPGGKPGLDREKTIPVTALPANAWGLYQMHGNVLEWCADGKRIYGDRLETDPRGPEPEGGDAWRVMRGGSWFSEAGKARSAFRHRGTRVSHRLGIEGFRFSLRSVVKTG